MFARLEAFYEEFGHTRVPEGWPDDPKLAAWVPSVRARVKAGTLRASQRSDLARVEFEVSPRETEWKARMDELARFKAKYGHTSVARWSTEFSGLGVFVTNLRVRVRAGHSRQLSPAQRDELNSLGFDWKALGRTERRVVELEHAARAQGRLPRSGELGAWTARTLKGKAPLDSAQIRRLEALGLDVPTKEKRALLRQEALRLEKEVWIAAGKPWPPPATRSRELAYQEKFAQLEAFEREFDHTRVPVDDPLYRWTHALRTRYRARELAPLQIAQLKAIGFEFEPNEAAWRENFERLQRYQKRFGHADVPRFWKEDPRLGAWVTSMRQARAHRELSAQKVRSLEGLGLTWKPREAQWARSLRQLDAFIAKHGHAKVPTKAGRLGAYLVEMRRAGRQGRLSREQLRALKARGVELEERHSASNRAALWEQRFEHLRAFHHRHGHCAVPRTFTTDDGFRLGFWVSKQREARADQTLTPEREAKLEQLGFHWIGRPVAATSPELEAALEHYRAEGHWVLPPGRLKTWLETLGPGSDPQVRARLSALGAPMTGEEWAWERMFAVARDRWGRYRRVEATASSLLGTWLRTQVDLALSGALETDREARLAAIGALNPGHAY